MAKSRQAQVMLAAVERSKEVRAQLELVPDDGSHPFDPVRAAETRRPSKRDQQQIEALSLRMAGLSYDQISERLGVEPEAAFQLVEDNLTRARNNLAEPMRDLENIRLDRVQAAIWPEVLKGDLQAVNAFLTISQRRSRMNGLDAPKQIAISANVRMEMKQALDQLRSVVLGEVVQEALNESDSDSDDDDDY